MAIGTEIALVVISSFIYVIMRLKFPHICIYITKLCFNSIAGEFWLMSWDKDQRKRYLKIEVKATPPEIYIEEGEQKNLDRPNAREKIFVTSLPIRQWKPHEPIDLLLTCTQMDFKLHFNGKLVKSITNWHDDSWWGDSSAPLIRQIGWRMKNNMKLSKVSWNYGKILFVSKLYFAS